MKKLLIIASLLLAQLPAVAQVLVVQAVERVPVEAVSDLKVAAFSPDGDCLLLTTMGNKGLYRLNLADNALLTVSEEDGAGYQPRITDDGSRIVFRLKHTDDRHLRLTQVNGYNVATGELEQLLAPTHELSAVALSGNTAVTVENGVTRRHALRAGGSGNDVAPVAFVKNRQLMLTVGGVTRAFSPCGTNESYIWPSVSPDGQRVLFYVSGRGAYVCRTDGSELTELGQLRAPQWYGNDVVVGMNDVDDGHEIVSSGIVASTLTGQQQTLTTDSVIAIYPQTAAGAGRIAFSTPSGELYIITLDK